VSQGTLGRQEAGQKTKDEIVLVAPNGAQRGEKLRLHDTVAKTLEQAVKAFGKEGLLDPSRAYTLVRGATPLEPGQTLEQAGVQPGDRLNVRVKEIPADGDAPRA
jgi:hypothetical protein